MKNVLGLLSLQKNDRHIREFTDRRPIASIPFAGRYRIVDFALSGMVNSGIDHVGVLLPSKARSILDHLRSGKEWDLARRHEGLIYLPPGLAENGMYEGELKNCYDNLDFVEHSSQRYVLIADADEIYNADFTKMFQAHQNSGADITLAYFNNRQEDPGEGVVLRTAPDDSVIDIAVRPTVYRAEKTWLGACLMSKRIYIELVKYTYERGGTDFFKDVIMKSAADYSIFGYEHSGYAARINTTMAYYKVSMDLLNPAVWQELFMGERRIYTKIQDRAPVEYKATSHVSNSLLANGCIIRGEVEHSIMFRGVEVGEGASVKNCIIMEGSVIEPGAVVENVICDKNVTITRDKSIKGGVNYPMIVTKDITI